MHDALNIIAKSEGVRLPRSVLVKLVFETSLNVVVNDVNVVVPVWPCVLVEEPNCVAKLVDHNTIIDTPCSQ